MDAWNFAQEVFQWFLECEISGSYGEISLLDRIDGASTLSIEK